ncbi:MAG: chemotaxis protein CheB [Thermodesulfobacteriota bacterium]
METIASTGRSSDLVVVGASAGGLQAARVLLGRLPARFALPVVLVLHRPPVRDGALVETLGRNLHLRVKEADDQEYMQSGVVYLAPANYHVLIEQDRSFSLSVDPPVFFCRPAIDVLFESAATAVAGVVGCILSGANEDGVQGAAEIRRRGGTVLVQDPATAAAPEMPAAVIAAGHVDRVMTLEDMAAFLGELPSRPPPGRKTIR